MGRQRRTPWAVEGHVATTELRVTETGEGSSQTQACMVGQGPPMPAGRLDNNGTAVADDEVFWLMGGEVLLLEECSEKQRQQTFMMKAKTRLGRTQGGDTGSDCLTAP